MTALEMEKTLLGIARDMYIESQCRLDAIPKENKTEYKAVIIEREIYNLFNCRETDLSKRKKYLEAWLLPKYPKISEVYSGLGEDEKFVFLTSVEPELGMSEFLNGCRSELDQAKAAGDSKRIFEFQIKIGAVERVFEAWEEWREKNNVFPGLMGEMA